MFASTQGRLIADGFCERCESSRAKSRGRSGYVMKSQPWENRSRRRHRGLRIYAGISIAITTCVTPGLEARSSCEEHSDTTPLPSPALLVPRQLQINKSGGLVAITF